MTSTGILQLHNFSLRDDAIDRRTESEIRVSSSSPPARFKGCGLFWVRHKDHIIVAVPISKGVYFWVGVCIAPVYMTTVEITGKDGSCKDNREFRDIQNC